MDFEVGGLVDLESLSCNVLCSSGGGRGQSRYGVPALGVPIYGMGEGNSIRDEIHYIFIIY